MIITEELQQAYESAAFAVRHLERVSGGEHVPALIKLACRQQLKAARELAANLNELFCVVESES